MRLKLNLITIIVLFLFPVIGLKAQTTPPAFTASHLKAAEEYLVAIGFNTQTDDIINRMTNTSIRIPEAQRETFLKVLNAFVAKYFTWDIVKERYGKMYANEFTEDELIKLTAFYNTPLGQKLAQKKPILIQKGMLLGQQAVADHRPELEQMMKDAFQADTASTTKNN